MFSCACLCTARMIDGFEPARIFLQGSYFMAFIIKDSMKVSCFPVVSSDQSALPEGVCVVRLAIRAERGPIPGRSCGGSSRYCGVVC